ncbi:MAG: hypothetical protein ACU0E9_07905 [Limimaricola soesokkakensis]|uniref:hypothetical protein n=1 Tax=Limimaricola soesokkakensis TaxID=1343159 RepID=UPI004059696E
MIGMQAIMGGSAAARPAHTEWPTAEPAYITSQSSPTFSFFEKKLSRSEPAPAKEFAGKVGSIFAALSEGQEPLGAEFEAVWDANMDDLYES